MLKIFRSKMNRLHFAQLGILICLGGILMIQAHTLIRSLRAGAGLTGWSDLSPSWVLVSGLDYILVGVLLVLVGIFFVYKADAHAEYDYREPLQDLLQWVDAAAKGDLSRTPELASHGEMGNLSQAVGRLISVVARSEKLVYHLTTLVESSSDAIISFTLDGTISSWNKGAQRIYGYASGEVKGRSITLLTPHDQGAEMLQLLERIRAGERLPPFETVHEARSGRSVQALVRVTATLDSTLKVIGGSFCAQDLTQTQITPPKPIETKTLE